MGPTLYIVHRLSPYYEAMEITRQGGLATIHNCLWYIYGALLQQGKQTKQSFCYEMDVRS